MKTVRFSEVVKRCGSPEPHLVLVVPKKDKALQAAIKGHRVMTVFQPTAGAKTDFGNVGFEEGNSRQYLVFPKPLRAFAGKKVVGIKYDLLSSEKIPKRKQAPPPKPPKKRTPKQRVLKGKASPAPSKVVPFPPIEADEAREVEDVREMKRLARQAMHALEDGKHVAAFNLLKRLLTL